MSGEVINYIISQLSCFCFLFCWPEVSRDSWFLVNYA